MSPDRQPALADTQREFFSSLLMPLRGRSRRSTGLPPGDAPHDPAFLDTAERLIRRSPTLGPAECLELYHRQYWFRLLGSIEEDFPGLIRFLGEARFWEIIEAYLLDRPSSSFTLRHLGRGLPDFLDAAVDSPTENRRAVSIARLETAVMEAFEAASLPVPAPEEVASGSFGLQPHVILLALRANASEWLEDESVPWRDDGERAFYAAVWRTPRGGVVHAPLDAGSFRMLSRLRAAPVTLDGWLADSTNDLPDETTLSQWFTAWRDCAWFTLHRD